MDGGEWDQIGPRTKLDREEHGQIRSGTGSDRNEWGDRTGEVEWDRTRGQTRGRTGELDKGKSDKGLDKGSDEGLDGGVGQGIGREGRSDKGSDGGSNEVEGWTRWLINFS